MTTTPFKGVPNHIQVLKQNGSWNSKAQVILHVPSPTGDSSDWLNYVIPCVDIDQATVIANKYAEAFNATVVHALEQV